MIELLITERTKGEQFSPALYSVLTDEERTHVRRYRRKEDQMNSFIGTLLARYLMERHHTGQRPIKRTASGQPYVEQFSGQISMSHSEEFIACAFHPNGKIGVDIEKVGDIDLEVISEFLSKSEQRTFQTMETKEEKLFALYTYWTLKEALFKAEGTGIAGRALTSIEFNLTAPPVLYSPSELAEKWNFLFAPSFPAYCCSVCYSSEPAATVNIQTMSLHELKEYFTLRLYGN